MVRIRGSCLARNSGARGFAPASGKSTLTPSLSSGAVIMKMISSTSITSMYGTTLISPISLRRRRGLGMGLRLGRARRAVALQNCRELFDEGVEPQPQGADLIGKPVVRNHRGNRREQADGRGDQRLGDTRRHRRQSGLLHITEIVEGAHDAPHGAEQAHV